MLVYTTPGFDDEIAGLGLVDSVEDQNRRIRSVTHPLDLRKILQPAGIYLKRRAGHRVRLIGKLVRVGDQHVFCWLAALRRDSEHYSSLLDDSRNWSLASRLDLTAVADFVERSGSDVTTPTRPRSTLPDEFTPWLEPLTHAAAGRVDPTDQIIFESIAWVDESATNRFREDLSTYRGLISDVLNRDREGGPVPGLGSGLYLVRDVHDTVSLVYCRPVWQRQADASPCLFLVAPFRDEPSPDDIEQALLASGLDPGAGVQEIADALPEVGRRAYPDYLIIDRDVWSGIERETASNLALSGEEEHLLSSVGHRDGDRPTMPLLINGRAGSGKSTMLAYLFAALVSRRFSDGLPGHPLFVTHSQPLLDAARDAVGSLLRTGHQYTDWLQESDAQRDATLKEIDGWFTTLRRLFLESLDDDSRIRFDPRRRVGFAHFKRALSGRPGLLPPCHLPQAGQIPAELCWFAIRSYIKGHEPDMEVDPERYGEFPRGDRQISEARFREIHDTIWARWYEPALREHHLWDDQDLAASALAALPGADVTPDSTAITALVCDESQDFTRREIMYLIQLSALTRLPPARMTDHLAIPLIMAGDPLQTVNPAGFRWESVTAALHEELALTYEGQAPRARLDFLAQNYRSAESVVHAVNLIQLLRSILFDHRRRGVDIRPQRAWSRHAAVGAELYIIDKTVSRAELRRSLRDAIVIVPCEDGDEVRYVRDDDLLSEIYPGVSDEDPPPNVLSASNAKGLEFDSIVLYRFGEALPRGVDLGSPEALRDRLADERDENYEVEYFFNKLYVAASRAKSALRIVDSEDGQHRLWQHLGDEAAERLPRLARRSGDWPGLVTGIRLAAASEPGSIVDSQHDIEAHARAMATRGHELDNALLLRQAAGLFDRLGLDDDATSCRARAHRIEGDLSAAGHAYLEVLRPEEAWECFWDASAWGELADWFADADARPPVPPRRRLLRAVVDFMRKPPDRQSLVHVSNALSELPEDARPSYLDPVWREVVARFSSTADQLADQLGTTTAERTAVLLADLAMQGHAEASRGAAACFFAIGRWDAAVRHFEQAGLENDTRAVVARAENAGYPAGLNLLLDAGRFVDVVEHWQRHNRPTQPEWMGPVGQAQLRLGDREAAFEAFLRAGEVVRAASLAADYAASRGVRARQPLRELAAALGRELELGHLDALLASQAPRAAHADTDELGRSAVWGFVERLIDEDWNVPNNARTRDAIERLAQIAGSWRRSEPEDPIVVGALLEALGDFRRALTHYESYVSSSDTQLRTHARQRWIVVKGRQIEYNRRRPRARSPEEHEETLRRRQKEWKIRDGVELPAWPQIPARHSGRQSRGPSAKPVPASETLKVIGPLHLTPVTDTSWTLYDPVAMTGARIDVEARVAHLGEARTEVSAVGDRLEFELGGCSVSIVFADPTTIAVTGPDGTPLGPEALRSDR